VVLGPRAAWAAPTPLVHLDVVECPSLDARSVQRIFSADLGTATTSETGPNVTEVTITCDGEFVEVRVRDPISRKTLKRTFDPKSFGSQAESRVVAIAASELVLASWAELAANPTPQVPPAGPPPSPEAVETARGVVRAKSGAPPNPATPATRSELPPEEAAAPSPAKHEPHDHAVRPAWSAVDTTGRATAVISVRSFFRGYGTLWGGGARFGRERSGVVSWALDALVEDGFIQHVSVTSLSVGGWLGLYAQVAPATFRLGAGLRAGMLGVVHGPTGAIWGWPMLVASQSLRFNFLVIDLSGEGGFGNVLIEPGKPALKGGWASGQLGIGIAL